MDEKKKLGFVRLGDIGDFQSGGTPSKSHTEYFGGNIPWITTVALNGDFIDERSAVDFLTDEGVKNSATKIVPPYALMVGTRVGVGKVAINKIPMCTNQDIISITNIDFDRWKLDYLRYVLRSASPKLNAQARGATIKGIKIDVLQQVAVPDILREKQDQIVNRLDAIQRCIQTRKEQLSQLDTLIKARFVEMFGDPKINEKGWSQGVISDFYLVKGGKRIPKGMGYSDEITAHPYLRATDMKNETILDGDIHYIDDEVFEHIKRYVVSEGDIYLTNVGVNLGMAGVIPDKYDGANLTENAVKLVPKVAGKIDGMFLAHYINSPGIQDYINERKMSVGVPKLAIFRIETMPLIIPPIELQQEFNFFVSQVDKSKVVVQKSLDELQILFDSLMQDYFG